MTRVACLSVLAWFLVVSGAAAQMTELVCDDRERLFRQIEQTQGAERHGQGMRGSNTLIEVWVDPTSGDWTLVQSYANGTACILAMGEHWQMMPGAGPA